MLLNKKKLPKTGKIILILSFVIISLQIKGQMTTNYKDIIPLSPTVSQLTKYTYLPVSLYTGIPNISIPLGEIDCGTIKIPISLSYHSSGIQVDQTASNVGLGWSLNIGGVISQTVKKENDLSSNARYIMTDEDIASKNYLAAEDIHSIKLNGVDSEPDIFSYNFLGFSGQFLMDRDGNFYDIRGKQDLSISRYNLGLKAVDQNGNIYLFESSESCNYHNIPYNCSFSNAQKLMQAGALSSKIAVTTAYYLTNIKSADGKYSVAFQYSDESYSIDNKLSGSIYFSPVNDSNNHWIECGNIHQIYDNENSISNVPNGNFTKSWVEYHGKRLIGIETNTGERCTLVYAQSRKDLPGTNAITGIKIESKRLLPSAWSLN